jgi:hypothetical protein
MSATTFENVLSKEELEYFQNHPEVFLAKSSLDSQTSGKVSFTVPITDSIRDTLQTRFSLSLPTKIPMRWIKGDSVPHVDTGASTFKNTYLVYLNDSPGELIVDAQSYPIQSNIGYVFQEGLSHETQHTENMPRLMIGPMNELAEPVGNIPITYFATETDALNQQNAQGGSFSFTVGSSPGTTLSNTSWKIASNSPGSSPQNLVYNNGDDLNSGDYYFLYPALAQPTYIACFNENTKILTNKGYVAIQDLRKGDLVVTLKNGYKPVDMIGYREIENVICEEKIKDKLYVCTNKEYPEIVEDLIMTGCHSILVDQFKEGEREKTKEILGDVFVTDGKLRLPTCVDERASPYEKEGKFTIYHIALENEDYYMNYGIYANGLIVETCSKRFLKEYSGTILME